MLPVPGSTLPGKPSQETNSTRNKVSLYCDNTESRTPATLFLPSITKENKEELV